MQLRAVRAGEAEQRCLPPLTVARQPEKRWPRQLRAARAEAAARQCLPPRAGCAACAGFDRRGCNTLPYLLNHLKPTTTKMNNLPVKFACFFSLQNRIFSSFRHLSRIFCLLTSTLSFSIAKPSQQQHILQHSRGTIHASDVRKGTAVT